jgi:hypothetical protein
VSTQFTPPRPPCHIGIVTNELDRAMSDLRHRFGLSWSAPRTVTEEYITPAGRAGWAIRVAHSSGPIAIELIEGGAGSPWACSVLTDLHHYAFWSSNLAADVAALEQKRYEVELTVATDAGSPARFAYLVRHGSARLELIERPAR